ncbi:phage terminase large subunit [Leptolyngbya sp. AN02str]|uniref:phage terminase large subunit n=1 Tax=Leptolyngbya sp. AN02str TaxID=3423363 RepID=UPI003D315823
MAAQGVKRKQEFVEELEREFDLVHEVEEGDRAVLSFVEFINQVNPKYKWSTMSERLAALLQSVADGALTRLMIFVPPRHGKSELVSRLFSAYYLYRYPERWVGINSYAAELAYTFSRAARQNFKQAGGSISDASSAVNHWETNSGGGVWAAGVGGPITGKGFSLGIIDDPLKNHEDASSSTIREKQKDWYDSTFYTRAEEDGAIVLLQTRWHEDDLSGWLLSKEHDEDPEGWHIVCLEAIKESGTPEFPPSCTIEPDWRSPGEPLNPVRLGLRRLQKIRARIRGYFWQALYQQRPRPVEGNTFKESWFQRFREVPDQLEQLIVSVDASFKGNKTSSFVVIQLWGLKGADFYLLNQQRDRMGFVATKEAIRRMIDYCQEEFLIAPSAVLIEDKANGPAIIDELKTEISGLVPINPGQSSKEARAEAVSPYYEGGNVWIPESAIARFSVKDYVDEFLSFPDGVTDDQVDASSQIIWWVMQRRRLPKHKRHQARSVGNW